ncbi:hypothetical protein Zmor_019913 [Zophobas morio]|uniref:Uncharacterized protein n=1 Tax=Zophobas morio TaxID=2755281 RepID=A0AA38I2U0_9CUCU|nr:hypothetical protein Zmor_019913 [Zophobas morio]
MRLVWRGAEATRRLKVFARWMCIEVGSCVVYVDLCRCKIRNLNKTPVNLSSAYSEQFHSLLHCGDVGKRWNARRIRFMMKRAIRPNRNGLPMMRHGAGNWE